jgi:hypothetical protein
LQPTTRQAVALILELRDRCGEVGPLLDGARLDNVRGVGEARRSEGEDGDENVGQHAGRRCGWRLQEVYEGFDGW